jgi:pimeloyl-ACP methyl ester carboxylesterase
MTPAMSRGTSLSGVGLWSGALWGIGALVLAGCGSDFESKGQGQLYVAPEKRVVAGWERCGMLECSQLEVPVDYAQPDGEKLSIALNRSRAEANVQFQGSILFNPGGPGGSGTDFLSTIMGLANFNRVFPGFDLVSFDPRGVASSGGITCPATPEALSLAYDEGGIDALVAAVGDLQRSCEQVNPSVYAALGSVNVVRDMDAIRAALGAPKLNFYGGSYGSRLGALYAQMFPEQTRAIVLDGVVQPVADQVAWTEGQFEALISGQEAFLQACASSTVDCPDQPERVFADLAAELAAEPGGKDGLVSVWSTFMAIPGGNQLLAQVLRSYADEQQATNMPNLPESGMMPEPLPVIPDLDINLADNLAVHCIDNTNEPPPVAEVDALIKSGFERSPVFAPLLYIAAQCLASPVPRDPVPVLTNPGQTPILIVGGTTDTRTPFAWAEEMRASLGNAVLVRSEHSGHIALLSDLVCPVLLIRDYFQDLSLPSDGTRCDRVPPGATP